MDTYLEQCKKFREYRIDAKVAISDLEELKNAFSKHPKRSSNHKYKANNWLKIIEALKIGGVPVKLKYK